MDDSDDDDDVPPSFDDFLDADGATARFLGISTATDTATARGNKRKKEADGTNAATNTITTTARAAATDLKLQATSVTKLGKVRVVQENRGRADGSPDGDPEDESLLAKDVTPKDVDAEAVAEARESGELYLVGTQGRKVTRIAGLSSLTSITILVLRSNLITKIRGISSLIHITNLDLYDNRIEHIRGLDELRKLRRIDLTHNHIRTLQGLNQLTELEELYCASNKLTAIGRGLEALTKLRVLDLGFNRIRKLDGLSNLSSLEELWLGKNKIERIEGLESLTRLRKLDLQNNRLQDISPIATMSSLFGLQELFLSFNAISNLVEISGEEEGKGVVGEAARGASANDNQSDGGRQDNSKRTEEEGREAGGANGMKGGQRAVAAAQDVDILGNLAELQVLDLSRNQLTSLKGFSKLKNLEDLWVNSNLISDFAELKRIGPQILPNLRTVYLEHNPIYKEWAYRKQVITALPQLSQVDSVPVHSRYITRVLPSGEAQRGMSESVVTDSMDKKQRKSDMGGKEGGEGERVCVDGSGMMDVDMERRRKVAMARLRALARQKRRRQEQESDKERQREKEEGKREKNEAGVSFFGPPRPSPASSSSSVSSEKA